MAELERMTTGSAVSALPYTHFAEQVFVSIEHAYLLGAGNVNARSVLLSIQAELKVISDIAWKEKLNATSAIRGNAQGGNKLRTYACSQLKQDYGTESYVTIITRKCYRSAYTQFYCGVHNFM